MRRLQYHQKKVTNTKIILLAALLIGLLIFIFTIGLQWLLNSAVFVNKLVGKKEVQTTTKSDFYGSLDVDSIPNATNSAKFVISGTVTNFDKLEYYLNGEKIKENDVYDRFEEIIGDLKVGTNEVYLIATSKKNDQKKQSNKFTIYLRNEKPKLEITEPTDGTRTDKNEIKITGKTDKEIIIQINSFPVVVDALGSFQSTVKLNEGENVIIITAQDLAENIESKTLKVIYEKD
jgi:hypothetical protein